MLAVMSILNTTQRKALHASLQQREQQLLLEISTAQDEQTQQAQNNEDLPREPDADQSSDRSDREVRQAEKLRDQHELAAVRTALQRMDDGTYGECADCGNDIALERLKAYPSAMRCIACQTKAENKAAGKA